MTELSIKLQELKQFYRQSQIRVIHYGCESWFNVKDRPVAVSCIVVINLATHEQVSFSLTDYNDEDVTKREIKLLEDFYKHVKNIPDAAFLHWNMHSSEFGFAAIDKRFKFLTDAEAPYAIPEGKRFDLDALIGFKYEENFADHPKLATLGTINNFNKRFALSGKEEANKFEAREYGDIQRSTTEKTQLLVFLANKFFDGTLETKHSGPRLRFANENLDAIQIVLQIGMRLKTVARQLKIRRGARPTLELEDEYDFQDLFHSLLRIFFDDIRAEEWVPSYAGGHSRIDFILPAHSVAIELKHSRPSMNARELGDQLIIDIVKYREHKDVRILVCLVFDPAGHISNPVGIETDLTGVNDNYSVWVKILN